MDHINQLHEHLPMLQDRRTEIIQRIHERCIIVDYGAVIGGVPSMCHQWTGPTSGTGRGGGYGRMSLNGRTVATHLVAYTHFFGYIPSNRLCCNPLHMELVTHLKNQKRRAKRAKQVKE